MKRLIIASLMFISFSSALAGDVTIVECSAKIENKVQSMKIKINNKGLIEFWSDKKFVETKKNSYFGTLADLENFGLEGHSVFFTPNGYSVLSVINTAESIDIGVHKSFTKGFYNYHDAGSGVGNSRVALSCKVVKN